MGQSRRGGWRTALIAFGIELPFSLFVLIAWLLLYSVPAAARAHVCAVLVGTNAVKTAALFALLVRRLAPITDWSRHGDLDGHRDNRSLLAALSAAYSTPLRFALLWASAWLLCYFGVTALLAHAAPAALAGVKAPLPVGALFSAACFFAALPLAYTILGRLLLDVTGQLSLEARARGLPLPGPEESLGRRLVMVAFSLAAAPTCWLSAVALARSPASSPHGVIWLLVIFAIVPIAWAPVCAAFLGTMVASPFRRVGTVIEDIVRTGDVERLAHVPVHFRDEIGALSSGVNAMIDRLERDAARSRDYVAGLEQLDRAKDQFIRVAAHELKTPVTILRGYSLLLLRSDSCPGGRTGEMLAAIDRGAVRIHRVVEDLLAISQVAVDRVTVRRDVFDLAAIVRSAGEGVGRASGRRLDVQIEAPGPMPVRGDAARIRQVLGSLLDNAILYSPEGGPIEVSVTRAEPPETREAIVSVCDCGVGIPEDQQAAIFEVFHRAHTDTPHDRGGLGVGLFLAKDLITRQGGRMWFTSREGVGSTFCFSLPLAETNAEGVSVGVCEAPANPGGR